jgi:hypothetical protein
MDRGCTVLAEFPELERAGFEAVERSRERILIHRDWRGALLEDLLSDFLGIDPGDRRTFSQGRTPHFSYWPRGAPGRVFVRALARGGLLGRVLGELHCAGDRPIAELRAACRASLSGVHTPQVVAIRSRRTGAFSYRHAVVTREIEGGRNLLEILPTLRPPARRELLGRVAAEVRRLHEVGIYPADLTIGNVVIASDAAFIVDLDKPVLRAGRDQDLDARNLSRFLRSSLKRGRPPMGLGWAEQVRFLRDYLGGAWCLRDLCRRSRRGLWLHRVWWALGGAAPVGSREPR